LVGALKVHFPKTFSLTEPSAGYVSALLQRYSEEKLTDAGDLVGAQHCFVIDVGSQTVYPPAKSIAARLKDIEDDCRNIAALRPTITPDE
jgi:hypothetical protein